MNRELPVIRTEYGFQRTSCSCDKCADFCSHMPGMLAPADLPRMAQAAGYGDVFIYAAQRLIASPGAVAMAQGRLLRIPTLVPSARADGACIFWLDDRLCSIHAVSPFGCAFVDEHMDADESGPRVAAVMADIHSIRLRDGEYWRVWKHLWALGRRAPDRWPQTRNRLWHEAMAASTRGGERQRAGALRVLTLLTGEVIGDVPR